mgnify:CR=1 FL=1|jgi:hypothetical protein
MEEKFTKLNDYTLRVTAEERSGYRREGYTRLFNFLARQVTTTYRDWLFEDRGSNAAGEAAMSATTFVESFDDLPGTGEVALMHGKLKALGGNPPALDSVLPDRLHKKPGTPGLRN